MIKDDIIRIAWEAGFHEWENTDSPDFLAVIQRFAALVADAELRQLHDELDRERSSRQAAQVENEDLKARLARAGLERQQALLKKESLLWQALKALKKYHGNFEHGELFTVQEEEECEKTIAAIKQHLGVQ